MKNPMGVVYRVVVVVLLAAGLHLLNLIGFTYIRRVNNDPFTNPVVVSQVDHETITLSDGRGVRISGGDEALEKAIQESDNRVDLEIDERGAVLIYGKEEIFICGTTMPSITIPLVPRDAPLYKRRLLDVGRFVAEERAPHD